MAKTLGQVAYERFREHEPNNHVKAWHGFTHHDTWIYRIGFDELPEEKKQAWEDAADAVAEKAVAEFRRLGE